MKKFKVAIALMAVLALLAAACGDDGDEAADAAAETTAPPETTSPAETTTAPDETMAPDETSADSEAQQGGTLVVALEATISTLDPHRSSGGQTHEVNEQIFEKLITADYTVSNDGSPPEIVPRLATEWESSPDGLIHTFSLREGVTFHDGTPFDAGAVEFNVRRVWDPSFDHYIGEGLSGLAATVFQNLEAVEVVDEFTVQFVLSAPFGFFIEKFATTTGLGHPWMISPAAVIEYGEEVADHPIGTGPFKFVEWVRGQHLTLEANRDYWRTPHPYVDELIFRPIEDESGRVNALRAGEVDMIRVVPPDQIPELEDDGFKIASGPTPHLWYIEFQHRRPPFDDPRVRQAVNLAIDRDGMAAELLVGTVEAAICFCSSTSATFNPVPDWAGYEYDPERARELLAEAGYEGGFDAVFETSTSGSGQISPVQMAEWIQRDLAEIGIDLELRTYEWNTYVGRWYTGMPDDVDMNQISWGDNSDYWLYESTSPSAGINSGGLTDEEYDSLLIAANEATSQEEASEFIEAAARRGHELAFHAPIVSDTFPVAMAADVNGFIRTADWVVDYSIVWLDR